jgi:hypothetical protein
MRDKEMSAAHNEYRTTLFSLALLPALRIKESAIAARPRVRLVSDLLVRKTVRAMGVFIGDKVVQTSSTGQTNHHWSTKTNETNNSQIKEYDQTGYEKSSRQTICGSMRRRTKRVSLTKSELVPLGSLGSDLLHMVTAEGATGNGSVDNGTTSEEHFFTYNFQNGNIMKALS